MKTKYSNMSWKMIFVFSIAIFFTLFNPSNSIYYAESKPLTTVCPECNNPLVRIDPCKLGGDVPDFESWGLNTEDLKKTEGNLESTTDYLDRALNVFTSFTKENPCADIYLIWDDVATTKRFGVKEGEAKYVIDSIVSIEKCTEGEKTLVIHEVEIRTELDEPTFTSRGIPIYYDLEEISNEADLVPTIGKVHVEHRLTALKNGQVYDYDYDIYDWIDQPAGMDEMGSKKVEELHSYNWPSDVSIIIDGELFVPSDGWLLTGFSTSTLAGLPMTFEKGEIGETIRKMETPTTCQVNIDTNPKYDPNFKLDISGIQNKFGEQMPNNVRIGLKVEEGKLEGGEMIDGWHVYNTSDGKVTDEILYRPPQCAISETDILEVCGICEFHDGVPFAGSMQFTKEIRNPLCHDAVVTINYSEKITKSLDKKPGERGDDRYMQNDYSSTIDGRITLTLEKHSEQNMAMYGLKWVNYMSTSMTIDKFSVGWEESKTEGRDGKQFGYKTVHDNLGAMTNYKWGMPDMPSMVTLVYDTKTNKVKSIIFRANYTIAYTLDITESWETNSYSPQGNETKGDSKTKTKNERFAFGPVEDRIAGNGMGKWIYPDLQVSSGDGKTTFGGRGNVERDFECSNTHLYDKCHESKTFEWNLTVNSK